MQKYDDRFFYCLFFSVLLYSLSPGNTVGNIVHIRRKLLYMYICKRDSCKHLEPALVQQLAICARSDRRYRLFLKITRVQMSSDGTKTIQCTKMTELSMLSPYKKHKNPSYYKFHIMIATLIKNETEYRGTFFIE